MKISRADFGDFSSSSAFNVDENVDRKCSPLTNCQVKSRCAGKRSCELVMDKNLLPSQYCSGDSKKIYTEYTCVDEYKSTSINEGKICRMVDAYKYKKSCPFTR